MNKNSKLILIIIVFIFLFILIFYKIHSSNGVFKLKGTWVADGTQIQTVIGYEDGEAVYSDISSPFYLNLDGKGNYTLNMEKQIESGTYSIYEEQVILKNRDGLITEKCKLKDKTKLYCEFYASLYVKK